MGGKMFDGSYETFEGLKKNDALVKVIAKRDDKILFSEEMQPDSKEPYYSLFGGATEEGETSLDGAKRELAEESGLVSNDWQLFEKVDVIGLRRIEYFVDIFLAKNCVMNYTQKLDKGEKLKIVERDFQGFIEAMTSKKSVVGNVIKLMLKDEDKLNDLRIKLDY